MAYEEYTGKIIPLDGEFTEYTGEIVPLSPAAGGGRGSGTTQRDDGKSYYSDATAAQMQRGEDLRESSARAKRGAGAGRGKTLEDGPQGTAYSDNVISQIMRAAEDRKQFALNQARNELASRGTHTETVYDPTTGLPIYDSVVPDADPRSVDERRTRYEGRLTDESIPGMTAKGVVQDTASGVAQIPGVVVSGVGQLGRLVTGDTLGKDTQQLGEGMNQYIQKNWMSDRARAQALKMQQDMEDPAMNPADVIFGNKGAVADQALPQVGSMVLPIAAASAAGKLAAAGNAAKLAAVIDPATVAARVGTAQEWAVGITSAAQNAADAYSEIKDKGGSNADAYKGAAIAAGATVVANKLTGGGAEAAIAKGALGEGKDALERIGSVALGAAKEFAQEGMEGGGGYIGKQVGLDQPIDAGDLAKTVALEGTMGALMGGGAHSLGAMRGLASEAAKPEVPRVENQPTTPQAPAVPQKPAPTTADPISAMDDKALLGTVPVEGQNEQTTTPNAPAEIAAAPASDQPAASAAPRQDVAPGAVEVPGAQPTASAAPVLPTATATLDQGGNVVPAAYDPVAKLQQEMADLKARTDKLLAEKQAAEEKAAAEAAAKLPENANFAQTSATPTAQPGTAPSPQLVGRLVERAITSYSKNADLTNATTYPEPVLYGIINSPDVGPELLSAARTELDRRRGTTNQPTVSYTGQLPAGTTSTGVAGQPQTPAGVSSVATVQPAVDTGVGQTVGGQPLLTSRATTVGSPAPAGTTRQLAPTAPDTLIAQVSTQLKKDRGVEFTPYKGPLTTGQQVASAFANANGRTFTVVDRKAGDPLQMPNGFAIPGTNHVVVDRNASDAPLLVAVHEVYHLLPTKLRLKANKALRALFKENLASEFGTEFNVTPDQFEEEIPAYMAQAVSSRPTFWQELRTKMGNKDFSEFASFVLQKFKDLMRGAESQLGEGFLQKYIGEESKILQAQQILADVYAESMREQGLQPDAAVMQTPILMSQKRTQNTEQIGGLDVTPAKDGSIFVHGDPEAIRAKLPEGVKGRVEAGGVRFTHSDAPRVRGALSGNTTAYSRAGQVNEKLATTKDGKYLGAPEKFNTPGKIPTLRKWLRTLAEEGAPGRFWYENSSKAILQMTGGDVQEARKFVALLAIYSPQAKVDANSTFALRAWAQYRMGQPISVKTRVMDSKAQRALDNVDEFWSGEKTGNFFTNLLSEIDPSLQGKQGATIDMWMMRAGQYDNDAPTKTQYAFMENETNRLARELGWDPHQVQAAIWVAMKARMENAGVKKRTEAVSEKKGWLRYDYPLKNGKPKKTRVILNAQAHRDNWLAQSFAHDPTKQDTATAKFDFSDGVRRHIGQVSWEARPGRSTGVLPGVNDAPYDQQVEFQQAVQRALLGPNGEDLLAQQLGLLVDGEDLLAPGVWQGEVAAGMQKQVAMAPAKGDDGKTALDDTQKQALDTYAAMLGLLLRQEGVGWHRPFYSGKKSGENGAELRIGSPFTPEQAQELWSAIDAAMREQGVADWEQSAGMISSPQGMRVVNFGALEDNLAFQRLVESAANGLSFDVQEQVHFTSDGNLVTNDWRLNPNGTTYQTAISDAGRSDLLGWARDVLAPRVQQVFDEYSEKYDWGDPGSIAFSNRASDGLDGVHVESGPGARPHAVRIDGTHFSSGQRTSLDGRYFGRGLKGAEQTRLAQATDSRIKERVYFYVNEGKGITPEAGVGGYAHAATVSNLYNVQGDPLKLFKANDLNGSESRVLDAGYSGYYFPNYVNGQGIAIVLGNASRGIKVEPAEFQKAQRTQEVPAGPYKYGLTGKELNAIDMPAVQVVAPSAKLRMGTFQVDEAELAAAREELANQGISLPDRGPVFSNKAQNLDQDITLDIPVEGGKTARLTINAQAYINQLDAREDALRMVKECLV